jgi:hypothetical protein
VIDGPDESLGRGKAHRFIIGQVDALVGATLKSTKLIEAHVALSLGQSFRTADLLLELSGALFLPFLKIDHLSPQLVCISIRLRRTEHDAPRARRRTGDTFTLTLSRGIDAPDASRRLMTGDPRSRARALWPLGQSTADGAIDECGHAGERAIDDGRGQGNSRARLIRRSAVWTRAGRRGGVATPQKRKPTDPRPATRTDEPHSGIIRMGD